MDITQQLNELYKEQQCIIGSTNFLYAVDYPENYKQLVEKAIILTNLIYPNAKFEIAFETSTTKVIINNDVMAILSPCWWDYMDRVKNK